VTRRQQLSDAQTVLLFDPPTEQRELVRHYTLSDVDLVAIRRCRGDHNRLGHALMLCYLRYPGRPLRAANGRRTRWLPSLPNRSTYFHNRSTATDLLGGVVGATLPSCRTDCG
jgi:uncharacterized protein DUF4158